MASTARARTILGRFPRHIEADAPGKLFEAVVSALATDLDVETAQVGRVRRAHRLGHADEHVDLLRLAALHHLRVEDFSVLGLRLAAVAALAALFADPGASPADLTAAGDGLATQLGLPADVFPAWPATATLPPLDDPAREVAARARLAAALAALGRYSSELDLLRARVRAVVALHRQGNGTVAALLGGAANNLDLDVEELRHLTGVAEDGFWHVARCRERLRLTRPEPPGTIPVVSRPVPAVDLVVLEENPFVNRQADPVNRLHEDLFQMLRTGFNPVSPTLKIVGVADRTVRPLVVSRDQGLGLGYHGALGDGQELTFGSDGQVLLDGADASGLAWSFKGAVFAGSAHPQDFVFADQAAGGGGGAPGADRAAVFAVTAPAGSDAFDPVFVWPHAPAAFEAIRLVVGETRLAFFVQQAAFGTVADDGSGGQVGVPALPVPQEGEFDGAVFAPPPAVASPPAQGRVGFSWREREAFAARVWLPMRFAALDVEGQLPVRERVRLGLERHRAAGVHVYVDYASDLWSVDSGILADLAGDETAAGLVTDGTRLWPDGTPPPA